MARTPKKEPSPPKPRWLEEITIVNNEAKKLAITARFDDGAREILARVGEGREDNRTAKVIEETASAFVEVLVRGYRRGWLIANNYQDNLGNLSIDYDANNRLVDTSYKGVKASVKNTNDPKKNWQETFNTLDPVTDLKNARLWLAKRCETYMNSSSLDRFASDVEGFSWDENDQLVKDTKNTTAIHSKPSKK